MMFETTFTGFVDRAEAGCLLAAELSRYRHDPNTLVVGLPRGGVVTAAAVADALNAPLDVLVIRKLPTPGQPELAMGAIGPGGVRVLNRDVIDALRIPPRRVEQDVRRESAERERRERLYRGSRPPIAFTGKTVILVDDGLATGSTMAAAIEVLREERPKCIVLAVPVAPIDTCERLRSKVDTLVYLETPDPFVSVGQWYVDFGQVSDEEVVELLRRRNPST